MPGAPNGFPGRSLVVVRVAGQQTYKPISQIGTGDMVLTDRGRWRPVTHITLQTAATMILRDVDQHRLELTPSTRIYSTSSVYDPDSDGPLEKCGCEPHNVDSGGFCACCEAHLNDPDCLHAIQGDGTHHYRSCPSARPLPKDASHFDQDVDHWLRLPYNGPDSAATDHGLNHPFTHVFVSADQPGKPSTKVYSLMTVEDDHSFIVEGVLVADNTAAA